MTRFRRFLLILSLLGTAAAVVKSLRDRRELESAFSTND